MPESMPAAMRVIAMRWPATIARRVGIGPRAHGNRSVTGFIATAFAVRHDAIPASPMISRGCRDRHISVRKYSAVARAGFERR
jgi:hypothetical protein